MSLKNYTQNCLNRTLERSITCEGRTLVPAWSATMPLPSLVNAVVQIKEINHSSDYSMSEVPSLT